MPHPGPLTRPAGVRGLCRAGIIVAAVVALLAAGAGPASAAPLASDNFEDGDAAGWTTTGGVWVVTNDGSRVLSQSGFGANAVARTGQPGWSDYTVTADVKAGSFNGLPGAVGVVARAQSPSAYYAFVLRPDNTAALLRVANGTTSTLASARTEVDAGTWYRLSLRASGRTLTGSVGGTRVTASDGFLLGGPAGLVTVWATASFDNVTVG